MPRLQPLYEGLVRRSGRRLTVTICEAALIIEVAAQCKTRRDRISESSTSEEEQTGWELWYLTQCLSL